MCDCNCNVSRADAYKTSHKSQITLPSPIRNSSKINSANEDMIFLPGGTFLMGSEDDDINPYDGESPIREVKVKPFYIDPTPVTNDQFKKFIEETNYKTEAEVYGWSYVFHLFVSTETAKQVTQTPPNTPWWGVVKGAYWKQPEGPDSSIENRLDHPVVHVSWNDANAYCEWAGKRLLNEKEWEYAARGGLVQKRYPWGDDLTPEGKHMCNIWQGKFPMVNTADDGYKGTSPVKAFPPNNFGLYSVAGNTWEWCANSFSNSSKTIRGGSYLCHASYCNRYRVAARTSNTPDSSTGNIGFRCGLSASKEKIL